MPPEPELMSTDLDRAIVVLHEPQDLVNVALVVRAMKNMGLSKLRLVRPAEYDEWRISGIAHDTRDVVERIRLFDSLEEALADTAVVIGSTARRRTVRQTWREPDEIGPMLGALAPTDRLALLLGREDSGLPNEALDLCHGAVCIPTNPDHPSLNLAHAVLVLCYELRKWAGGSGRDLSPKKRRDRPLATHAEMEEFFGLWEKAMTEAGLFWGLDPLPKMRSFRNIFQRAAVDGRELGLLMATAYEIIHFAKRERARAAELAAKGLPEED